MSTSITDTLDTVTDTVSDRLPLDTIADAVTDSVRRIGDLVPDHVPDTVHDGVTQGRRLARRLPGRSEDSTSKRWWVLLAVITAIGTAAVVWRLRSSRRDTVGAAREDWAMGARDVA